MQYKNWSLFFYLLLVCNFCLAQSVHDKATFNSPVNFPIILSGNYGEIRSSHFHAGIDIKTQGTIGKKVFAISDGYVSRIKISAFGYGKALYISHPDGYTSVYAHLDRYEKKIENFIKEKQYNNNEFEINFFPEEQELLIKKGELIAFSGNTGSSHGPHLHFEIRETANQVPINPLLLDFDVKDNIPPVFRSITFYPLSKRSLINNKHKKTIIKLKSKNNIYSIVDSSIFLADNIGFGVEVNDYLNNTRNKCGIYKLMVVVNKKIIYSHIIDNISFAETGYIKSHIDYEEKTKTKKTIQKTFIAPNNKLKIYRKLENNGSYSFKKDSVYNVEIIAKDVYDNTSILSFKAYGTKGNPKVTTADSSEGTFMAWNTSNTFKNNDIKIVIPKKALYDSFYFNYNVSPPVKNAISKTHHISSETIPLHKHFFITLKLDTIPLNYKNKVVIAGIDEKNKIHSIGGEVVNNNITAKTKYFGKYAVFADTVKPSIKPILKNNKLLYSDKIKFKIKDELSGIKSYNGYIDNEWALFEYDAKNDILFYIIDENRITKNKTHEIELFVIDNTDNVSTFYSTFYW